MKNKYCAGFFYDTEKELQELMRNEAYLDMIRGNEQATFNPKDSKWTEDVGLDDFDTSLSQLGGVLSSMRSTTGLSLRKFAKCVGVSVDTVSKVERGEEERLEEKTWEKIEEFLDEGYYALLAKGVFPWEKEDKDGSKSVRLPGLVATELARKQSEKDMTDEEVAELIGINVESYYGLQSDYSIQPIEVRTKAEAYLKKVLYLR